MPSQSDPFRHHPELRGLITDPAQSFFRDFDPSSLDEFARQTGMRADWRYPDDVRNALLRDALARIGTGDLWVFAYGSLMWDPAVHFAEVRHAHAPGYARRFILWDDGARGTPERPAVMAALDTGDGCDGLVFRIESGLVPTELDILWKREKIAPAYDDVMIEVVTKAGPVQALTFVANHDSPDIRPDLSHDDQVEALATARGMLGTNLEYIVNLKRHFDALGIEDEQIDALHSAAVARAQAG